MEVNFGDLLNVQIDSIERPKVFPIGQYDALVVSHEYLTSSKKGTPHVRFMVKLVGTQEVNEDEFEEAGGAAALNARKPLKLDFYLTTDAMFMLREFLENTLELSCSGRTLDVVIPEATNMSFTAEVTHAAGDKPGDVFMNIGKTALAA